MDGTAHRHALVQTPMLAKKNHNTPVIKQCKESNAFLLFLFRLGFGCVLSNWLNGRMLLPFTLLFPLHHLLIRRNLFIERSSSRFVTEEDALDTIFSTAVAFFATAISSSSCINNSSSKEISASSSKNSDKASTSEIILCDYVRRCKVIEAQIW